MKDNILLKDLAESYLDYACYSKKLTLCTGLLSDGGEISAGQEVPFLHHWDDIHRYHGEY